MWLIDSVGSPRGTSLMVRGRDARKTNNDQLELLALASNSTLGQAHSQATRYALLRDGLKFSDNKNAV